MNRQKLIDCFRDTLEVANAVLLSEATKHAIMSSRIYKEGFIANHIAGRNQSDMLNTELGVCIEQDDIVVEAKTTFAVAIEYCKCGKIAVLNFANPENPGGGVQLGAMAQEECLCRSSNLYLCLNTENVLEDYYQYHKHLGSHLYSDRLIYTKNVTVFKDDSAVPQLMP